MFLAKPEWRCMSQKGEPYEDLLDILMAVPLMAQKSDEIESLTCRADAFTSVLQLLNQSRDIEDKLLISYANLQNREHGPVFWMEGRSARNITLGLNDHFNYEDIFPQVLMFPNVYTAQVMLLYWGGSIFLYSVMLELLLKLCNLCGNTGLCPADISDLVPGMRSTLGRALRPRLSPTSFEEVIQKCEGCADKVCQAIAGYQNNPPVLLVQAALFPLLVSQEFFHRYSEKKFLWCQKALRYFQKGGLMMGGVLSEVRTGPTNP